MDEINGTGSRFPAGRGGGACSLTWWVNCTSKLVVMGPDDFNGIGSSSVLYWTGFGFQAIFVEKYVLLSVSRFLPAQSSAAFCGTEH